MAGGITSPNARDTMRPHSSCSNTTRLRPIQPIPGRTPSRLGRPHPRPASSGRTLRRLPPQLLDPGHRATRKTPTYAGCTSTATTISPEGCTPLTRLAITAAMPILTEGGRTTTLTKPLCLATVAGVPNPETTAPRLWTRTIIAEPRPSSPHHPRRLMCPPHRRLLGRHLNRLRVRLLIVRRPASTMAPRYTGAEGCAMPPQRGLMNTCRRITPRKDDALAPRTPGRHSHRSSGLDLAIGATLSRQSHGPRRQTRGNRPRDIRPPRGPCRPKRRDGALLHLKGAGRLRSSGASLADSKRKADKAPPHLSSPLALSVRPAQSAPSALLVPWAS
jgi:hypothetical protein